MRANDADAIAGFLSRSVFYYFMYIIFVNHARRMD